MLGFLRFSLSFAAFPASFIFSRLLFSITSPFLDRIPVSSRLSSNVQQHYEAIKCTAAISHPLVKQPTHLLTYIRSPSVRVRRGSRRCLLTTKDRGIRWSRVSRVPGVRFYAQHASRTSRCISNVSTYAYLHAAACLRACVVACLESLLLRCFPLCPLHGVFFLDGEWSNVTERPKRSLRRDRWWLSAARRCFDGLLEK